jgi:ATP-dependent Lhr-like helicase
MRSFDLLHPALKHHIVNSLGWRELRPFQEEVIQPILEGRHFVILAPTAGGKTEAALFPVFSRMLSEGWTGLTVLYVCPIRALLNNLAERLDRYCGLLGRRSALWHGDIGPAARKRIVQDPPDVLLTTPESLEVMLVSGWVDRASFFRNVRVAVVDEIHAFAGDDRGWHLAAVLERITKLAGREIQRIGLSATVGNPGDLLEWLAGSCKGPRGIHAPARGAEAAEADVTLDYVGTLENAAQVIARMHRGEKRLVFLDSRARAEELAAHLRELEVDVYATHSSLSRDQRQQAESAFAGRENCVIVATSVLELGVDVGDLDRVIQIDAPATVSSFLQRMGRTGRRPGTRRNCLFLATGEEPLLHAAGLIELWSSGYVEPVHPPAYPLHVFAQQLMALALQEGGMGRNAWRDWVGTVRAFAELTGAETDEILRYMLEREILWEDEGILWFGRKGEEEFGRRNFMDLLSVISSEPLVSVFHGSKDLGSVHPISFVRGHRPFPILLLGGRSWAVTHLDWKAKTAFVEPSMERGRSRWQGSSRPLSLEVCQSILRVVSGDFVSDRWSRRARAEMERIRGEMAWAREGTTTLVRDGGGITWWTFAGIRANSQVAGRIRDVLQAGAEADNLSIEIQGDWPGDTIEKALRAQVLTGFPVHEVPVPEEAVEGLKFSTCLPPASAQEVLRKRLSDPKGTESVLTAELRSIQDGRQAVL